MISVIIAARDEGRYIGDCLCSLLAQDDTAGVVEIIVSANACQDDTVTVALGYNDAMAQRGWNLTVLELSEAGKPVALNAADAVARGANRLYLDADVTCAPDLLGHLCRGLDTERPTFATGQIRVASARSWVTRRYAEVWLRLPFVRGGAVGAGLFAVNKSGRARWAEFPEIISDDTFVRLHFAPTERIEVAATYSWPMVEGLFALVRVRRRQDAGVLQVYASYPDLKRHEAKPSMGFGGFARLALDHPVSVFVYLFVHLAVRLGPSSLAWTRGR